MGRNSSHKLRKEPSDLQGGDGLEEPASFISVLYLLDLQIRVPDVAIPAVFGKIVGCEVFEFVVLHESDATHENKATV